MRWSVAVVACRRGLAGNGLLIYAEPTKILSPGSCVMV
jgi:hypothetical protein